MSLAGRGGKLGFLAENLLHGVLVIGIGPESILAASSSAAGGDQPLSFSSHSVISEYKCDKMSLATGS